ncbi:MAG: macro domain-containing protein [Clostridiales bacterium]|nr:macro domain-containing protein [Clostridiales bacterium]
MLAARRKIGRIKSGDAVITPAFNLDARYVIHTVRPVWENGSHGEEQILASCYRRSLELAKKHGCESRVRASVVPLTAEWKKRLIWITGKGAEGNDGRN